MSSGNGSASSSLDRILKLWISLWNLVLENKRHYQSVCAVLQRLVFEKTEWPKHKNWPVICQLGKTEPLMQRIIQDLDITQINERNARIIAAFGDCFSHTKVSGIPLSVVIDHVARRRAEDPYNAPHDYEGELEFVKTGDALLFVPDSGYYIDDLGFPLTFLFESDVDVNDPDDADTEGLNVPKFNCPEGVSSENTKAWTTLAFQGQPYVVVETYPDGHRITLVPAEYIELEL